MADLSAREMELVAAIQSGLPLVSRPYAAVGAKIGMSEQQVIKYLADWQADGTIRRMGVIVRHHELGYRANAMVVWNIPDEQVQEVGRLLGEQKVVTLCYQRPRRLPDWPYNLFCMIHGQDRDVVLGHVETLSVLLSEQCDLSGVEFKVLFSRRRFKQRGARSIKEKAVMPQQIAGSC